MKIRRLKDKDIVQLTSDITYKTLIYYQENDIYRNVFADNMWILIWNKLRDNNIVDFRHTIDNKVSITTKYYAHAIVNDEHCIISFGYNLYELFTQHNINMKYIINVEMISGFPSYSNSTYLNENTKQIEKKSLYDIEEYFNNNLWSSKSDILYDLINNSTEKTLLNFKNIVRKEKYKKIYEK